MDTLTDEEIRTRLADLDGWERDGNTIRRDFDLDDFVEAVEFTRRLVEPAEEANHHPDLEVSWGSVVVHLTTHDAGGLTDRDFSLARTINRVYREEFS